jgi:hypothetical protein
MQTSVVVERVFQVESFRFVVSLQQGSKARQVGACIDTYVHLVDLPRVCGLILSECS